MCYDIARFVFNTLSEALANAVSGIPPVPVPAGVLQQGFSPPLFPPAVAFRSLLSFLSRLPLGAQALDGIAPSVWAIPLAGGVLAILLGGFGFLIFTFLPLFAGVPVFLLTYFALKGSLHMDGLSDMADALASQGTVERRQRILKDPHAGMAGILAILLFLVVVIFSLAGLSYGSYPVGTLLPAMWMGHSLDWAIFSALIVAELNATTAMVFVMGVGRPSRISQLARPLVEKTRMGSMMFGLVVAWGVSLILGGVLVVCVAATGLLGIYIARTANRALGGVNGDVLGAAHEVVFAACLLIAVLLPWTPIF